MDRKTKIVRETDKEKKELSTCLSLSVLSAVFFSFAYNCAALHHSLALLSEPQP